MPTERLRIDSRARSAVRRYPSAAALCFFLALLVFYRLVFYSYPAPGAFRNPFDLAWDVTGFTYHFVMLAFDLRSGVPITDYHARQALRYKPSDPYISKFVSSGEVAR